MTATERRYQGQSDEILSMEDPDDYGETIHKLSFKKALEYKPAILSDYKVVTIHISQEEIAELVRNRAFVMPKTKGWSKEMEAENLAALIALRKAMSKYPIRHAVSFHGSIKRAQDFQESNDAYSKSFPANGRLQTFHVSGKTPTGTRAKEIDQFSKAPRSLITNARCLTEGVDVPNIDAVLFADPRKSLVDIVQAVGRALRPSPNKKFGYVIVPVVHKNNAKPEDIFDSDSFKEVLTTLRALGSQDDRIIEYFRAISQGRSPKDRKSFESILSVKIAKRINLREFVRSVELRCWDRLSKLSWRPFIESRDFARSLKLQQGNHWRSFCSSTKNMLPADIPKHPSHVYKDQGWIGINDWLGNGKKDQTKISYWSFLKARSHARSLRFRRCREWIDYCKKAAIDGKGRPWEIPRDVATYYKNSGWKSWVDFLGLKEHKYWSFQKARSFAHRLRLKNMRDWRIYRNRGKKGLPSKPSGIPSTPDTIYKNKGWIGWKHWLGTEPPTYIEARCFVRALKIINSAEWRRYAYNKDKKRGDRPSFIPCTPKAYYKSAWRGWGDWLGGSYIPAVYLEKYPPYQKARLISRALGLTDAESYKNFIRHNKDKRYSRQLHLKPYKLYKKRGWMGWADWLGKTYSPRTARPLLSFNGARKYVRRLNIKTSSSWLAFARGGRLPYYIPRKPQAKYRHSGWKGWPDFLGIDQKR